MEEEGEGLIGETMSKRKKRSKQQPKPVGEQALSSNEHAAEEEEHPLGTLALLMLYLVVLMTFWGYLYTLLVLRGG
jgi:hypothetical protein